MKSYTIEDKKMMEFAKYCIDSCGCCDGCCHFNSICVDYFIAKNKSLDELQTDLAKLQ